MLQPLSELKSTDGRHKAELIKKIHEKAKLQIERSNERVTRNANKGRQKVIFKPGDWDWVHFLEQ